MLWLSHKINIRPKIWYRHTVLSSLPFYGMPKLQMEHTLQLPNALFNITHATAIFQELNNPEHSAMLYATFNEKISCQQLCHLVVSPETKLHDICLNNRDSSRETWIKTIYSKRYTRSPYYSPSLSFTKATIVWLLAFNEHVPNTMSA
jgi:hypothetical protein